MPTPHLRGRFTAAMYRAMGMDDCVAADQEQYVRLAVKWAKDPAACAAVRERIQAAGGALFEDEQGVEDLARFLQGVARPG